MPRPRILIACSNYWSSPFQVGSHHLARGFARAGWQVAFISDPLSPWHLLTGPSRDLWRRAGICVQGGLSCLDDNLWAYVPFAWMTPHNRPVLRSDYVHQHWQRWTTPRLLDKIHEHGFGHVDLLYIDSITQSFWLDELAYEHTVYRVADYNPQFDKYTPAACRLEQCMAQRVQCTLYPSHHLKSYVDTLGARRSCYFPNGVDYEHFAAPRAAPADYAGLARPIAVYMGVIPEWFHFDWVRAAARALPDMSFVLIGPAELARDRLDDLPNVRLLGVKDYADVPAYLQHADVGLMPFNPDANPLGVAALNPQKLYAYLSAGIPVVSSSWDEIRRLSSPAQVCGTCAEFIAALRRVKHLKYDRAALRRYAAGFDWNQRVATLLDIVQGTSPGELARAG